MFKKLKVKVMFKLAKHYRYKAYKLKAKYIKTDDEYIAAKWRRAEIKYKKYISYVWQYYL